MFIAWKTKDHPANGHDEALSTKGEVGKFLVEVVNRQEIGEDVGELKCAAAKRKPHKRSTTPWLQRRSSPQVVASTFSWLSPPVYCHHRHHHQHYHYHHPQVYSTGQNLTVNWCVRHCNSCCCFFFLFFTSSSNILFDQLIRGRGKTATCTSHLKRAKKNAC